MSKPTTIGIFGIGLMGHGIASNLVRKGHDLGFFEHSGNQPVDDLRAGGAQGYTDRRALAARSSVVILVLTGSPQVEEVLTGPGGVLEGLRPGSLVIDCSTSLPASTVRMAEAVHAAGSRFLDAPMTRTPKEAAEGRLNLLVGGDAGALEAARPVLACFAENITHVGPVGAGHGMKLVHNFVSLGMVTLVAEAAASASGHGISPEAFVEVLAKGGGGGIALERLKPYLLAGDTSGLKFSLANARKDLGYYQGMAQAAGAHRALADAVVDTLDLALARAEPGALVPQLASLLRA
jgi:3-hydroxyisobutyrate dehydrogenase-like beta-hydroxyacid dehydrogenase